MNSALTTTVIGFAALSLVMALNAAPVAASDARGGKYACRSSIVGTYLTTEEMDGEFASRSVITFHRDGTVAAVDARETSGETGTAFSAQQGSYRCTGRKRAVATMVDFGFPPDVNIGLFELEIEITRDRTVEGDIKLSLFTPLPTCNPFEAEETCDLVEQVEFSFTSVRVPAEAD